MPPSRGILNDLTYSRQGGKAFCASGIPMSFKGVVKGPATSAECERIVFKSGSGEPWVSSSRPPPSRGEIAMPVLGSPYVLPVLLLIVSNCFMTAAWYWHLRYTEVPIVRVIIISWSLALIEYCFAVPANRIGSSVYD